MNEAIFWILTVYLVGIALFPIAYLALPNLMDRGVGVARPLGLLTIGALVWFLSLVKVIPNAGWTWWTIALLLAVAGWTWVMMRKRNEFFRFIKRRWLQILATEIVFISFFAVFAVVKAMDPDVSHTEQPMDLMMLNAVVGAENAPPNDLWLSGQPIAYYYFGYWMFGGIAQMSDVQPSIAYNLSIATIAALAAAAVYSLVSNLVRRDGATSVQMLVAGLLSVVLLLLISNLNGMWELLSFAGIGTEGFYEWLAIKGVDLTDPGAGWRPGGWWWWWASSRVINRFSPDGTELDFTIQEFPYFSLMLGDLHPHLMSIPFVLTTLAMIANIAFSRRRWGFGWFRHQPVTVLTLILLIGSTGFINTWDMGWMLFALGGVVYSKSYRENGREHLRAIRSAVPFTVTLIIVGAAYFSNFYFVTMQSQVQFPPLIPTKYATRPIHFLTVWGGLILVCAVIIGAIIRPIMAREISSIRDSLSAMIRPIMAREISLIRGLLAAMTADDPRSEKMPWLMSIGTIAFFYVAWASSHYMFNDNAGWFDAITRLPLSAMLGVVFVAFFVATYRRGARGADDGVQIVLLILTISSLLLYIAELFRLHDFFASRHNTVFKFYYQVWIFFAVAGGYAAFLWIRNHPSLTGVHRYVSAFGAFAATAVLAVSLYYAPAALAGKSSESGTEFTLDGIAFLGDTASGVPEALEWIRRNVGNDDVLVEAPGSSYSQFGRYSGFTGRPAILGWTTHQSQWRGGDEWWVNREQDIERIFTSRDDAETLGLIELYSADYVVVSPNERAKYTGLDASKFDSIGRRAFENEKVIIFALGE